MSNRDMRLRIDSDYRNEGKIIGKYATVLTVLCAILVVAGLFTWIYLLSAGGETNMAMIRVALITGGILLVGSILGVLFIGYDTSFWKNTGILLLVGIILMMAGIYLTGVHVLADPGTAQTQVLYPFIRFILNLLLSAALIVIPAVLVSGVCWLITSIFDRSE